MQPLCNADHTCDVLGPENVCECVCGLEERAGVNFDGLDELKGGGVGRRTFCVLCYIRRGAWSTPKKEERGGRKGKSISFSCILC